MKLHANAPLGPKGRAIMVSRVLDEGLTLTEAAEAAGVSERTAGKWTRRYRAEGEAACSIAAPPRDGSPARRRSRGSRRSPRYAACG